MFLLLHVILSQFWWWNRKSIAWNFAGDSLFLMIYWFSWNWAFSGCFHVHESIKLTWSHQLASTTTRSSIYSLTFILHRFVLLSKTVSLIYLWNIFLSFISISFILFSFSWFIFAHSLSAFPDLKFFGASGAFSNLWQYYT